PRLAIPFAGVGAAVVDLAVAFGLLLVLMVVLGPAPGPSLLLLPVIVAVLLLAALGVGTLLAALNVAYRDFRYVIPFLIQVWMFATPTIYMEPAAVPAAGPLQTVLALNPMTAIIASFRAACLGGAVPWADLAVASASVAGLFLAGCF